jgi:hypothetical protein
MKSSKLLFVWAVFPAFCLHAEQSVTVASKDYLSGSVASEWAQYTLSTSGNVTVKTGANVNFNAGSSITLYPGFKVEAGSVFQAAVSYNPSYNPGGYYNGITPTIALIGGDQQYGQAGQFNLQRFDIVIWNTAGTAPLVNAPVLLTVNSGGGWISTTNDANAVLSKTLLLTTDIDGAIFGYYKQGTTDFVTSSIQVVAGGQSFQFTTYAYTTTTGDDTDRDGISNTAETLAGLNSTQVAKQTTTLNLSVFTP